jgi:hypothetical protein
MVTYTATEYLGNETNKRVSKFHTCKHIDAYAGRYA